MNIRPATIQDAQAMLDIYAPFVLNSVISFELEVPKLATFAEKITSTTQRYPWLVAEQDDAVIGYAYASPFRERAAYDLTAESSIYVLPDFHSKKIEGVSIAARLYDALFTELQKSGFKQIIGVITSPNRVSENFHTKMGFKSIGIFSAIGFKFGHWHDVHFMQKPL